jgi:hypothetical protein
MRAVAPSDAACGPTELCLEVKLDSWLLGMLAPPIELAYDRNERKLLRYRGISNIRDSSGKSQSVEIHYRYRDEAGSDAW